jgi:hypothetical protein
VFHSRFLVGILASSMVGFLASPASASIIFRNITNNCAEDLSGQLKVDVSNGGTLDGHNTAVFTFTNSGEIASSICDVYFQDGTLLGMSTITPSAGVSFAAPARPGNLPGGNSLTPAFYTTRQFSADSDSPVEPNGVSSSSEWLRIKFTLLPGKTFSDTAGALANGSLRIGLHVQGIGLASKSDSYVSGTSVPEPATLTIWALLGTLAITIGRRLRKAA